MALKIMRHGGVNSISKSSSWCEESDVENGVNQTGQGVGWAVPCVFGCFYAKHINSRANLTPVPGLWIPPCQDLAWEIY